MLDFHWDASSIRWVDDLPGRIETALRSSLFQTRARLALDLYAAKVRAYAPRSATEGPHMGDDWQVLHIGHQTGFVVGSGKPFFFAIVGSRRVQPAFESSDFDTAPFNVPWGVQDGFDAHRVWLYLPPGVKMGPRIRRKLAQFVGAPTDSIERLKKWLREQERPPWITVTGPPRPYIGGPGGKLFYSELGDELAQAAHEAIGTLAWRRL